MCDFLCSSGGKVGYTQYGRAYNFFDLSNSQTMNAAFITAIYSKLIMPQEVEAFVSKSIPFSIPFPECPLTCTACNLAKVYDSDMRWCIAFTFLCDASMKPSYCTVVCCVVLEHFGQAFMKLTNLVQEVAPYSNKYLSDRYLCWTMAQSRYILGDHKTSFVVGFGGSYPKRVNDRGAACPPLPQNCTSVNSLYNPAANPNVLNGAMVYVRHHPKLSSSLFAFKSGKSKSVTSAGMHRINLASSSTAACNIFCHVFLSYSIVDYALLYAGHPPWPAWCTATPLNNE